MRRTLLVVVALLAALAIPAAPAGAHDSTSVFYGCTDDVVAYYVTAAGNEYETTRNVCAGVYAIAGGNAWHMEGVERLRCYRNDAVWDGCRWAGSNVETQARLESNPTWIIHSSVEWSYPGGTVGSTGWRTDSLRRYAGHFADGDATLVRGAGKGGQVRFRLADGNDVLMNMSSVWSATVTGAN
jgi:hypothetical protein